MYHIRKLEVEHVLLIIYLKQYKLKSIIRFVMPQLMEVLVQICVLHILV